MVWFVVSQHMLFLWFSIKLLQRRLVIAKRGLLDTNLSGKLFRLSKLKRQGQLLPIRAIVLPLLPDLDGRGANNCRLFHLVSVQLLATMELRREKEREREKVWRKKLAKLGRNITLVAKPKALSHCLSGICTCELVCLQLEIVHKKRSSSLSCFYALSCSFLPFAAFLFRFER